MSDSQFSAQQPVYPGESSPGQTPDETVQPTEAPAGSDPQLGGAIFEIGGKTYTEDEVNSFITRGPSMQADYTRKTQALADQRREQEAEYDQKLRELDEREQNIRTAPAQHSNPYGEDVDPNVAALQQGQNALLNELKSMRETAARAEQDRQTQFAKIQHEENLEAAVDSVSHLPFCDRNVLLDTMKARNWGPEDAQLAYNALWGAQVGRDIGRQIAIAQGAGAQPPMGGNTTIATGATHPMEMPNTEPIDVSQHSWRDISKMAAEDPEIG